MSPVRGKRNRYLLLCEHSADGTSLRQLLPSHFERPVRLFPEFSPPFPASRDDLRRGLFPLPRASNDPERHRTKSVRDAMVAVIVPRLVRVLALQFPRVPDVHPTHVLEVERLLKRVNGWVDEPPVR